MSSAFCYWFLTAEPKLLFCLLRESTKETFSKLFSDEKVVKMCEKQFPLDLLNCCRACASETHSQVNLFQANENGIILSDMISQCVPIDVERKDDRPSIICNKCISNLKIAYEFQKDVKASEEIFQAMSESLPKEEKFEPQQFVETVFEDDEKMFDFGSFQNEVKTLKTEDVTHDVDAPIDDDNNFENFDDSDSDPEYLPPETKITNPKTLVDTSDTKYDKFNLKSAFVKLDKLRLDKEALKNGQVKFKRKYVKKKDKPPEYERPKPPKSIFHKPRYIPTNVTYECYKCRETVKDHNKMFQHMKDHSRAAPHKCLVCEMYFSTVRYKRHLCQGNSVQCEYCSETFDTTTGILKHLEGHKKERCMAKEKCTDCEKIFTMNTLMQWHQRHHHKTKLYNCNICNRGFWRRPLFYLHYHGHSEERRKNFIELNFSIP